MFDINSRNRITLIGRVGHDLEVRELENGRKVVNLNICTNEAFNDDAGERHEKEMWHRATAWGPHAERLVNAGVKKGSLLRIDGRLGYDLQEKTIEGVVHHYSNPTIEVEDSINLTPKAAG